MIVIQLIFIDLSPLFFGIRDCITCYRDNLFWRRLMTVIQLIFMNYDKIDLICLIHSDDDYEGYVSTFNYDLSITLS